MSEMLSRRLREESLDIQVPVPPSGVVIARGRALRRRRRGTAAGLAAAAAVAVVTAGVAGGTLLGAGDEGDGARVSRGVGFSAEAYRDLGALAVDGQLFVAGQRIPFDRAVKSFYYTSAGVVVRSGTSPWTDDSDIDHYTLVTPEGEVHELDLATNDRVVGTEPDSGRLAYADPAAQGEWDVVVVDTVTGDQLSRTRVTGEFTWGGWEAPPVALDGDMVWVHFDGGWTEVDWRTEQSRKVPGTASVHEIANGRYAQTKGATWTVRSMTDGAVVSKVNIGKEGYGFFAPDGAHLRFFEQGADTDGSGGFAPFVYDVRTGARQPLPAGRDVGWTPNGDLLLLAHDGTVRTCAPDTGACLDTGLIVRIGPDSTVKLGGNPYES